MNPRGSKARLAIVATTPDDSHMWNLVGVQLKLEERGFEVRNLGSCTPAELVAKMVRDLRPDLLVISSINGHGSTSIISILNILEEYQVKRSTTVVAGGLLTTDPALSAIAEIDLLSLGCAGVFTGDDVWSRFDNFLKTIDSKARRTATLPASDTADMQQNLTRKISA